MAVADRERAFKPLARALAVYLVDEGLIHRAARAETAKAITTWLVGHDYALARELGEGLGGGDLELIPVEVLDDGPDR